MNANLDFGKLQLKLLSGLYGEKCTAENIAELNSKKIHENLAIISEIEKYGVDLYSYDYVISVVRLRGWLIVIRLYVATEIIQKKYSDCLIGVEETTECIEMAALISKAFDTHYDVRLVYEGRANIVLDICVANPIEELLEGVRHFINQKRLEIPELSCYERPSHTKVKERFDKYLDAVDSYEYAAGITATQMARDNTSRTQEDMIDSAERVSRRRCHEDFIKLLNLQKNVLPSLVEAHPV